MNKALFSVEITNKKRKTVKLVLPASEYELLDAIQRLNDPESTSTLCCNLVGCYDYGSLLSLLSDNIPLYELNDFAKKLIELDEISHAAFEGLVQMEIEKREGEITISKLMELAHNTSCCNVIPALNDYDLGKFYVENDFISEMQSIPEELLTYFNFSKIGQRMRESEHGVFTYTAYVVKNSEPEPFCEPIRIPSDTPEYIFRMKLRASTGEECNLDFPLEANSIEETLRTLEISTLSDVSLEYFDGIIPDVLPPFPINHEALQDLNDLAIWIQQNQKQVIKLKAVSHAETCNRPKDILELASYLDNYTLTRDMWKIEDIAISELHRLLKEEDFSILLPHIDLVEYGAAVVENRKIHITPYGVLRKK